MNAKLKQIQDWTPLARQAAWTVSKLAKLCGVSVRTLERHFLATQGQKPKVWLAAHRQKQAFELLRDGSSPKETASTLCYRYDNHFAREFKTQWGFCPTAAQANFNAIVQKRQNARLE